MSFIYIYNTLLKSSEADLYRLSLEAIMVSSKEMDSTITVHILDKVSCISYCTNTLGKALNPGILLPAMIK